MKLATLSAVQVGFLISSLFVAQPGLTAQAPFSAKDFFDANLKKAESALQEKHIRYQRTGESIRFLDTDKTSKTYGLTVELFGNLTARFSGNGTAGWVTLETGKDGSELIAHTFANKNPAIDDFLLKRTRNFEVITGFQIAAVANQTLAGAYMFESVRPTSPKTFEIAEGLLVNGYRDGTEKVELESADALKAFNKAEEALVQRAIGGLIFSQSVRTNTQHSNELRDMRNGQGNYSWMAK